jgi:hypothetical protein
MPEVPLQAIRSNLDTQIDASKKIAQEIDRLSILASKLSSDTDRYELDRIASELVSVGKDLSASAVTTGQHILDYVRKQPPSGTENADKGDT